MTGEMRDRDVDAAAVLADADRLEVVDALPAAELLEDLRLLVEAVRRERAAIDWPIISSAV